MVAKARHQSMQRRGGVLSGGKGYKYNSDTRIFLTGLAGVRSCVLKRRRMRVHPICDTAVCGVSVALGVCNQFANLHSCYVVLHTSVSYSS